MLFQFASVNHPLACVCGRSHLWKKGGQAALRNSFGQFLHFGKGCGLRRPSPAGKDATARRCPPLRHRRSLILGPPQRPFRMIQRKWAYNGDIFTLADCFRSSGSSNCLRNWKAQTTKMTFKRKGNRISRAGDP